MANSINVLKNLTTKNSELNEVLVVHKMKFRLKKGVKYKSKKKKSSFYTSKKHTRTIKDRLLIRKHAKIPVLKNGNCLDLNASTIKNDFVTVNNIYINVLFFKYI